MALRSDYFLLLLISLWPQTKNWYIIRFAVWCGYGSHSKISFPLILLPHFDENQFLFYYSSTFESVWVPTMKKWILKAWKIVYRFQWNFSVSSSILHLQCVERARYPEVWLLFYFWKSLLPRMPKATKDAIVFTDFRRRDIKRSTQFETLHHLKIILIKYISYRLIADGKERWSIQKNYEEKP